MISVCARERTTVGWSLYVSPSRLSAPGFSLVSLREGKLQVVRGKGNGTV